MNEDFTFERLNENIYVCINPQHRFGTDAFLLSYFSKPRKKDLVCDLGTGCGIIPLLMCRKDPPLKIFAVDIQSDAIKLVKEGIRKSGLTNIIAVNADLKELWDKGYTGRFDLVTCNPPYKAKGAGIISSNESERIARHETQCDIFDVCKAASRLLKFGGRLCLCNRPERLCDVIEAMRRYDLEPKRIRFAAKNENTAPWLFMIEGKKGSKPFLKAEPTLLIRNGNGFSDELIGIYKN